MQPTTPQARDTPAPQVEEDTITESSAHRARTTRTAASSRGTRPSDRPEGTQSVSLYYPTQLHDAARSAYVVQFIANDPDRETSMARWMGAVLTRYATMTPQQRYQATQTMPQQWDGHISRTYHLPEAACERMDAARADTAQWVDPNGAISVPSRSRFLVEALWVATETAKAQAGGTLPPVAGRLPSLPA